MLPEPVTPITQKRPTRDQLRQARHLLTCSDYSGPDCTGRDGAVLWAWSVLRADRTARLAARQAPILRHPGDAA